SFQVGLDYKSYKEVIFETNNFIFTEYKTTVSGQNYTTVTTTPSPVPTTRRSLSYLPMTLHWDASRPDSMGTTALGFNYSPNLWYYGAREDVQNITASPES